MLGIPPIEPAAEPKAHAGVLAAARQLRLAARRVIGFFPAERRVAVPPVLVQLGRSLNDLGTVPVGILDANARFPAFQALATAAAPDSQGLGTIPLQPCLDVVTPGATRRRPFSEQELATIVAGRREQYRYLLVDLSGVDESFPGFDFVDAVVLVAHSRTTRERALALTARQVPRERQLGVLLVG